MRWGQWIFGVGMAAAFSAGGATASPLPEPPGLAPAVAFWERVFATLAETEGVIHDRRDLARIYTVVALPPADRPFESRRVMNAARQRLADQLQRLAAGGTGLDIEFAADLRAHFPADATAEDIVAASEHLRVQRGLARRFADGYRRSGRWLGHIRRALAKHGVPPELAALPHVESSFRADVSSHAGAVGLWQFTGPTGRRFMRVDHVVDERRDPWLASEAAARLLSANYEALGDWALAVTAYNHGVAGMARAVESVGSRDIARIIEQYRGSRFGFASRNFYPALLAAARVDAEASRHFPGIVREPPLEPTLVEVPHFVAASTLADALGLPAEELRAWNPALAESVWSGRKLVPRGYRLRLPTRVPAPARALAALPRDRLYTAQRPDRLHTVRSGDTLSEVAARYGVGISTLAAANGLGDRHLIRIGQRLRLPVAGAEPTTLAQASDGTTPYYRVGEGDTLSAIAVRHGLSLSRLISLNDIDDPGRLAVGRMLRLREAAAPQEAVASADDEG